MAITQAQFGTLEALFNYYDLELFGGQLKDCLLNLSRKNGAMGFFAPRRWTNRDKKVIHEISINPDTFNIDDEELHRTLVHEMCHLWQEDFGKPSRRCYHNKQWANKMISVGMMPSHNGQPGGKITGQRMNDYTIPGGLFETKYREIIDKEMVELKLPYYPSLSLRVASGMEGSAGPEYDEEHGNGEPQAESRSGKRARYMCGCGIKVWGRPELNLVCGDCNGEFVAQ